MPDLFHPLQVAIDGNEANCANRVGSNVYAYEMIKNLEKLTRKKRQNFHLTILLTQPPVADLPKERPGFSYHVFGPVKLWTQWALPLHLYLHKKQYDVFYTPGHYAPRFCPLPYISSVMDLAFLSYPEQFRRRDLFQLVSWTRYSVKKATQVATISKYSKQKIVERYKKANEEVIVAYPALSKSYKKELFSDKKNKEILQKLKIDQPFFLYLGTLQPRKNLIRLITAFELFTNDLERLKNKPTILLVLAGKKGWLTDEVEKKVNSSPIKDKIILTGFVNEKQKAALLQKALANFNLGLEEGFGLPALESLAYQTLPVVANNSSLPEVIGDCGLKVNPFSVEEISKIMAKIISLNKKQKNKIFQKADKQLQKFSYEKSANLILTALLQIYRRKTMRQKHC